jgi:hypothetical protein
MSTWLDIVADLTSEQREEVRLLDYSVAIFRTFAGVHYDSDNRAGLQLGRRIVQEKLPDYLAETYGCSGFTRSAIKAHVQAKIATLHSMSRSASTFSWATWTPPKLASPTQLLVEKGQAIQSASGQAIQSASGDPHMMNLFGQRFDIARTGKHVLIHIPQGSSPMTTLLHVEADVQSYGGLCAVDMYISSINITGAWADAQQSNGFNFLASQHDQHALWRWFGKVELKVAWGHTRTGEYYLNFFVRHLSKAGHAVGGLLGVDDNTMASTPSKWCRTELSLFKEHDTFVSAAQS